MDIFLAWVKRCREKGINIPIIPGIMPIHTHAAFMRRAEWTRCHIPDDWYKALEPVKNDDAALRAVGKDLVAEKRQFGRQSSNATGYLPKFQIKETASPHQASPTMFVASFHEPSLLGGPN